MTLKVLIAALLTVATFGANTFAQQRVKRPIENKEWETPFPGFKIALSALDRDRGVL
jgi:hypothetical protein